MFDEIFSSFRLSVRKLFALLLASEPGIKGKLGRESMLS